MGERERERERERRRETRGEYIREMDGGGGRDKKREVGSE